MSARSTISPARQRPPAKLGRKGQIGQLRKQNATCRMPPSLQTPGSTLSLGTHLPRFADGLELLSLDRPNSWRHAAALTSRSQSSTPNLVLSHRRHGAEVEAFSFIFAFTFSSALNFNHTTDDPAAWRPRPRRAALVASPSASESQSQKAKTSSLTFHLLAVSGLPSSHPRRSGTDPRPPRVDSP